MTLERVQYSEHHYGGESVQQCGSKTVMTTATREVGRSQQNRRFSTALTNTHSICGSGWCIRFSRIRSSKVLSVYVSSRVTCRFVNYHILFTLVSLTRHRKMWDVLLPGYDSSFPFCSNGPRASLTVLTSAPPVSSALSASSSHHMAPPRPSLLM